MKGADITIVVTGRAAIAVNRVIATEVAVKYAEIEIVAAKWVAASRQFCGFAHRHPVTIAVDARSSTTTGSRP